MLVAVSGSQGAGKSSVLSCLQQRGYQIVKHKTARTILKNEWDIELEQIYSNPDYICKFQKQLIERKWQDELCHLHSEEIVFTERTYMDLFTYAVTHVGNKNTYSQWVNDYFNLCVEYQNYYKHVVFIRGGIFNVQHDNIRPSNVHYTRMVDLFLSDYLNNHTDNLSVIDFEGIEARADYIEKTIIEK